MSGEQALPRTGRPLNEAPPHVVVVRNESSPVSPPPLPPATPAIVDQPDSYAAPPAAVPSATEPAPAPLKPVPAPEPAPAPAITYEEAFSRFAVEARNPPPPPPRPAPVEALLARTAEVAVKPEPTVVKAELPRQVEPTPPPVQSAPVEKPLAPPTEVPAAAPLIESPAMTLPDLDADRVEPTLRASRVPSSRLGRLFHYGSRSPLLVFKPSPTKGTDWTCYRNSPRYVAHLGCRVRDVPPIDLGRLGRSSVVPFSVGAQLEPAGRQARPDAGCRA
jgi:hypothetical protein